jgi:acetoin utilization deacetylase AcuC-like enzyme
MIDEPALGFSAKPTLTGENVVLRPFILEADAPALREMLLFTDFTTLAAPAVTAAMLAAERSDASCVTAGGGRHARRALAPGFRRGWAQLDRLYRT